MSKIKDTYRCVRPRCKREPAVKYNADGPVAGYTTPKSWRGWLCQKHRDELDDMFQEKLRVARTRPLNPTQEQTNG
jgi:hypothetical protein